MCSSTRFHSWYRFALLLLKSLSVKKKLRTVDKWPEVNYVIRYFHSQLDQLNSCGLWS